jgi:predicted cupin superfamily sugar epimerase
MYRIRSDQLYHHYLGDPLEVLMLFLDGTGAVAAVGSDLARASVRSFSYWVAPSTPRACWLLEVALPCSEARSGRE